MTDFIKIGHVVTYNDSNLFEKFNIIKEAEEQQQFRNVIYNYDLLMIFNLEDFLEDIINEKINHLHDLMIKNEEIKKMVTELSNSLKQPDTMVGFMLLFSYDNLALFYPCICEFLEKGMISDDKLNPLKNNIFNYINN
jgi:hypothetical protein